MNGFAGVDASPVVCCLAISDHAWQEWQREKCADIGADGCCLGEFMQDVGDGFSDRD